MYISSLHGGKHHSVVYYIAISVISLIVISTMLLYRFVNVAKPFTENKARFIAIDIINSCVRSYIRDKGDLFDNLITLSRADDGSVTSAVANSRNINLIKSDLTYAINNALDRDTQYTVKIPLANYLGVSILSGIGTPISIKMHPLSRVLIDFDDKFSAKGINQTHLEILLKVHISVMVTVPGIRQTVEIDTSIPVAEAVFMGKVPSTYTYFDSNGGSNIGFNIK
ncbi:MAG: sporulation protein YunB [Bacillota bacterium]|nr:sporulation protein YunB [Bacillota bacterium]